MAIAEPNVSSGLDFSRVHTELLYDDNQYYEIEDDGGPILLGTNRGLYLKHSNHVAKIKFSKETFVNSSPIYSVEASEFGGVLWVGGMYGLYVSDEKRIGYKKVEELGSIPILDISMVSKLEAIVTTNNTIYLVTKTESGFTVKPLSLNDEGFINSLSTKQSFYVASNKNIWRSKDGESFSKLDISKIFEYSPDSRITIVSNRNNDLYIGFIGGIARYDTSAETLDILPVSEKIKHKVKTISFGDDETIWVSARRIFNFKRNGELLSQTVFKQNGVKEDHTFLAKAIGSTVWASINYGGLWSTNLNQNKPRVLNFPSELSSTNARFIKTTEKLIIVGTNHGLAKFRKFDYGHEDSNSEYKKKRYFEDIFETESSFWTIGSGLLTREDKTENSLEIFPIYYDNTPADIELVVVDEKSNIAYMNSYDSGLFWFDYIRNKFGVIKAPSSDEKFSLYNNSYYDKENNTIMLFNSKRGAWALNLTSKEKWLASYEELGLQNVHTNSLGVKSVSKGTDGQLYITFSNGYAAMFDLYNKTAKELNIEIEDIACATKYKDSYVGVDDSGRLFVFSEAEQSISWFDKPVSANLSGRPDSECSIDKDGTFVYTSSAKAVQFNANLSSKNEPSTLILRSIEVDGNEKIRGKESEVWLSEDESNLTINASLSEHASPQGARFEFSVNDSKLNTIGPSGKVMIPNIQVGKSIVLIRGINHSGLVTDWVSLTVNRKAPIYLSNLAFLVYSLIFLIIMLLMITNYRTKTKQKELESLAYEREAIASRVTHDQKTPLSFIINRANEILELNTIDLHTRNSIKQILSFANYTVAVSENILDFFRFSHGKNIDIDLEIVNLEDIVCDLKQIASTCYSETTINISTLVAKDSNIEITTDRSKLIQILVNLVDNAVKSANAKPNSSSAEVNIRITANKSNEIINFSVADNGVGISRLEQDEIFQEFSQSSKGYGKGLGLGLKTVSQLSDLLRGKISVESEYGFGAKFTVSLPIKSRLIERTAVNAFPESYPLAKKPKVLLMDDDPMNIMLLENMLNKLGLECVSHRFTDSFIVSLQTDSEIGLVITDFKYDPSDTIKDAVTLYEGNKEKLKELPVILWSGSSMSKNSELPTIIYDYFPIIIDKVNLKELKKAVSEIMSNYINT